VNGFYLRARSANGFYLRARSASLSEPALPRSSLRPGERGGSIACRCSADDDDVFHLNHQLRRGISGTGCTQWKADAAPMRRLCDVYTLPSLAFGQSNARRARLSHEVTTTFSLPTVTVSSSSPLFQNCTRLRIRFKRARGRARRSTRLWGRTTRAR
jgi:hypothetical protein